MKVVEYYHNYVVELNRVSMLGGEYHTYLVFDRDTGEIYDWWYNHTEDEKIVDAPRALLTLLKLEGFI